MPLKISHVDVTLCFLLAWVLCMVSIMALLFSLEGTLLSLLNWEGEHVFNIANL